MDDQGVRWAYLGNGLLATSIAHGWAFPVGVVGALLITNIAAYLLVATTLKNHRGEVKIKTPFLVITARSNRPEGKASDDATAK
jgi:hypothetical protein